ncbi:MAG: nucleotidyltransferase family protein [Planctomycetes bacterium]|nr:nucleotidyltransferase family protein [Planctomycetota bacterium]
MLSKSEIFRRIEEHRERLRSLGVRELGLFGSHARGDARPDSDVDLLVEFERKSFDSYVDTKLMLEDAFGTSVDLVLADGIKPRLRAAILSEVIRAPGF